MFLQFYYGVTPQRSINIGSKILLPISKVKNTNKIFLMCARS